MEIKPNEIDLRLYDSSLDVESDQAALQEFRGHYESPELNMTPEEAQILRETRAALSDIAQDSLTTTLKATAALDRIEPLLDKAERGGETGMLADKALERKKLKAKEAAPRRYSEKLLVVSDLQLLHETNEEGVGALLKYIKEHGGEFTHVVLNGDIIDFQQQSGFRKDNQLGDSVTQDEQVAGRWFIDFIGANCPGAKKVFMFGNHEQRYYSMYADQTNGVKQYVRPFEEVFGLQDWEVHPYGQGVSYDWHGRKIRHGDKGGLVANIPKITMDRNWRSTTMGHAVSNRMWEKVDGDGNSFTSFVHAGFSKSASYDKSGDQIPSNGFGVYFYAEVGGKKVENAYQVIMPANHSVFISPEGDLYDGRGFDLRQEIGLDPRGRGRPKKQL